MRRIAAALACSLALACGGPATAPIARNVVLVTIDTLRADHLGAYGWHRARTPTLDSMATGGARFERAYAAAPITLPSHATVLTGRYPPGHGARDNGMHVRADVPTLATVLKARGFRTAAFVAAFPLDHQFGLDRGFDVYSDRMPRAANGRPGEERPASAVVREAIAWLAASGATQPPDPKGPGPRFFVWVHLFEPHAPYAGDPRRAAVDRYDDEIATVDAALKPLIAALAPVKADTLLAVAGDHGEAFGEHGEIAHSIFVYDTTLHVPLIVSGPGVRGLVVNGPVSLADVAPTLSRLAGAEMTDVDGIDLSPALRGGPMPARELYAESFAPLLEFGWAPLRSVRADGRKFIAAPTPELYDLTTDPHEDRNLAEGGGDTVARERRRVDRYSGPALPPSAAAGVDPAAAERLRALGYAAGAHGGADTADRPDPKDRRDLAARIAEVTSGELAGNALLATLEAIIREDPRNTQMRLRLGVAYTERGDCTRAEAELGVALRLGPPSPDAYLALAACRGRRNDLAGAGEALSAAGRLAPDDPAIQANRGLLLAARGDLAGAARALESALASDPDLHEARFDLARIYARAGRRADAERSARELLGRLPVDAPERPEVERLLRALR